MTGRLALSILVVEAPRFEPLLASKGLRVRKGAGASTGNKPLGGQEGRGSGPERHHTPRYGEPGTAKPSEAPKAHQEEK